MKSAVSLQKFSRFSSMILEVCDTESIKIGVNKTEEVKALWENECLLTCLFSLLHGSEKRKYFHAINLLIGFLW